MTIDAPFTKEELLNELGELLFHFAEALNHVYGTKQVDPVNALIRENDQKKALKSFDFAPHFKDNYEELYDYAFNAVAYSEPGSGDFWAFVDEEITWFIELFPNDFTINLTDWRGETDKIQKTLSTAQARLTLDTDSSLLLTDVALLANLDEKTIRNLAGPKSKDPLKTEKISGRTYVNSDIAIAWLAKRGFRTTEVKDGLIDRDLGKYGFQSKAEIGRYITLRFDKMGMNESSARKSISMILGAERPSEDEYERLTQGDFTFDPELMTAIAICIEVTPFDFNQKILDVIHDEESLQLTNRLAEIESRFRGN